MGSEPWMNVVWVMNEAARASFSGAGIRMALPELIYFGIEHKQSELSPT
jgi:hypothetical protein